MRVLHVTDTMNPVQGGVCQAIRTMIHGLNMHKVHSEVVCLDHPDEAFLDNDLFSTNALGPADNAWSYSKSLKPWLLKYLESFSVVIVHGLWQYPGHAVFRAKKELYGASAAKDSRAPKFYVMPHGMLDPYFQKAPDRKLKALRNVVYWKLVEKNVVNEADGILFTCEEEKRLARAPFRPYRPHKELIVGLGVEEPPRFETHMHEKFTAHCPEIGDSSYFLFLSRIHEKKGIDLLIEAYAKYIVNGRKYMRDSETIPKLIIAGPGIESNYGKAMLNKVSSNSSLESQVFFPGMLSGQIKWGAFYGCEAFVLPSHQENFGIAVVEALACGKPVLISNKINIWREIETNGGGLVKDDSALGSYELLETWTKSSVEQKSIMGKKAKKVYSQYFSVDKAAANLLNVLTPK